MKSIHAICRKQYNQTQHKDLLDINLNVEKLSCGLVEFDLNLLITVY